MSFNGGWFVVGPETNLTVGMADHKVNGFRLALDHIVGNDLLSEQSDDEDSSLTGLQLFTDRTKSCRGTEASSIPTFQICNTLSCG